ncbi:unnamed protein product, partial [Ectocarpus sp. 4 AP-2014]
TGSSARHNDQPRTKIFSHRWKSFQCFCSIPADVEAVAKRSLIDSDTFLSGVTATPSKPALLACQRLEQMPHLTQHPRYFVRADLPCVLPSRPRCMLFPP